MLTVKFVGFGENSREFQCTEGEFELGASHNCTPRSCTILHPIPCLDFLDLQAPNILLSMALLPPPHCAGFPLTVCFLPVLAPRASSLHPTRGGPKSIHIRTTPRPFILLYTEREGLLAYALPFQNGISLCTNRSPIKCFLQGSLGPHRPIWISIFSSTKNWQKLWNYNSSLRAQKSLDPILRQDQSPHTEFPCLYLHCKEQFLQSTGNSVFLKEKAQFFLHLPVIVWLWVIGEPLSLSTCKMVFIIPFA